MKNFAMMLLFVWIAGEIWLGMKGEAIGLCAAWFLIYMACWIGELIEKGY